MPQIKVEVSDKNAIYVDGTRITSRNTKWGIHNIIYNGNLNSDTFCQVLVDFGFKKAVSYIDYPPHYIEQAKHALRD